MKKHNGMRPQDIVILLEIIAAADNSKTKGSVAIES